MERRNHARVAVNLEATLLDDQTIPTGCRVRDVSAGGMLLQRERDDTTTTIHEGDTVEARLSLLQGEERKLIPLPMTVRHVMENGIGAEFLQPQSQLMRLIEPYRLDSEETGAMAATRSRGRASAATTASPLSAAGTSTRASRRRSAIQRARAQFAETMKTAAEPAAKRKQQSVERTSTEEDVSGKGDRRLFYIGMLSLITAVGILLLNFGDRISIENRMSALESSLEQQVNGLTLLRARISPTVGRAQELAALNARVETLAASFAALEARFTQETDPVATPPETATDTTPGALPGAPPPASDKPATGTLTKPAASTQPQRITHDGLWAINLLSLYDKTAANRFTENARARGVRADTIPVTVKGKQVWRIQVSGFSTRDEASAYGDISKEKLGLKSVWIFKKDR